MGLQRQALSSMLRRQYAQALDRMVATYPLFLNSKRIAAYCAHQGEIDPYYILKRAWSMGKRCYLPILHPLKKRCLWFVEYAPGDPLYKNKFGILEPSIRGKAIIPAWILDLVLTPIVAFDNSLHRLGMGLGYYDQTFTFKHYLEVPILLGLAYEFQKVHALPRDHWDIPLSGIATEKQILSRN